MHLTPPPPTRKYKTHTHTHTHSDRLISNKLWRLKSSGPTKPVEWAYCFDVHLNAFFPLALYIYAIQMLCWPCMSNCFFITKVTINVPSRSVSYSQYSQYHGLQLHLAAGCHLLCLCHISRLHRYMFVLIMWSIQYSFISLFLTFPPPPLFLYLCLSPPPHTWHSIACYA